MDNIQRASVTSHYFINTKQTIPTPCFIICPSYYCFYSACPRFASPCLNCQDLCCCAAVLQSPRGKLDRWRLIIIRFLRRRISNKPSVSLQMCKNVDFGMLSLVDGSPQRWMLLVSPVDLHVLVYFTVLNSFSVPNIQQKQKLLSPVKTDEVAERSPQSAADSRGGFKWRVHRC